MSLAIRPVADTRDREAFLRVPYRIYERDPHYVFPLLTDQRYFLDPEHNPFFEHAQARLWVAYRDGSPIARVGACVDRAHV